MKEITINDQFVNPHLKNILVLNDALLQLMELYAGQDDILTDVLIDGEAVDISSKNSLNRENLDSIERLDLTFKSKLDIGIEYFNEGIKLISESINLSECIYLSYKGLGDQNFINKDFVLLALKLEDFVKVLKIILEVLKDDLNSDPLFMENFNRLDQHLLSTLNEIFKSKEAKDFVMLSDLIQYELLENLKSWENQFFPSLQKIFSRKTNNPK